MPGTAPERGSAGQPRCELPPQGRIAHQPLIHSAGRDIPQQSGASKLGGTAGFWPVPMPGAFLFSKFAKNQKGRIPMQEHPHFDDSLSSLRHTASHIMAQAV